MTTSCAGQPTILLEADSSELGKRGTGLDRIVLERLAPSLRAEGIDTTGSISDLGVRVRVVPVDADAFHYSIIFEIERSGEYEQALAAVDCKPCIDATLLEKIDARVPAFADAIKARAGEVGATPAEGSGEEGGEGEEEGPSTGDGGQEEGGGDGASEAAPAGAPIKRIGPLGYVGIGTAALGLGATIGGAVELSRGLVIEDLSNLQDKRIDHRPPGYALVGVGATAFVAGVVMLGIDVSRHKRKTRAKVARAKIFPILNPESAGLGIVGEF